MDWQGLWQLLQPYLAGQARHFLAALAGAAVAKHIIQPDQQSAFVDIGFSIVCYVVAGVLSGRATKAASWLLAEKARLEKMLAIQTKIAAAAPLKQPPAPSVQVKQ